VAVTGSAVYVGGHQRWGNNPLAGDKAGAGAVPRPGITALDPLNGIPLTWNPGRNPRGHGAEALLATGTGLYVGMDTNWIGNFTYQRKKLAYFPLAGGATPPSQDTGSLATDNVYLAGTPGGGNNLIERSYDGTTAGPDSAGPGGGPAWSNVRGAFMAGNTLYYGFPDSSGTYEMARQSFDGKTFGAQQILNTPYKDPYWDGVNTGSGTSIYDGVFPTFYGAELKSVTGMFYAGGKLYYATPSGLFSRGFSIDSGIVGATSLSVPSTVFDFTKAGGMFLDSGNLYVVNKTTGTLSRMAFTSGAPSGTATVVSDPAQGGRDWRASGLFLGPTGVPPANQPPVAAFTSSCPQLTCSFDASGSSDPENGPLTYAWDFGDGTTGTGVAPSHPYTAAGTYNVTLTVTDNQNATNAVTHPVTATAPAAQPIAFKTASAVSTPGGATSISITYPTVAPGDGLVLILSNNSGSTTSSFGVTGTAPGFTQVGIQTALATPPNVAMTTQVFQRVAVGNESGTKLTVPLTSNGASASAKATLQLLDYSGTPGSGPVRTVVSASDNSAGFSHTTPDATATAGDWVVSVWSDKSSYGRTWTGPTSEVQRSVVGGGGSPSEIATLIEDAGQPVASTGTVPGLTASVPSTTPSAKAAMFSIVLAGS
jgi:PKD repeat protein